MCGSGVVLWRTRFRVNTGGEKTVDEAKTGDDKTGDEQTVVSTMTLDARSNNGLPVVWYPVRLQSLQARMFGWA